jgi:plasminogen activator inhibitor 1 RNA-binding protein
VNRTGIADHPKQAEHAWGENTGEGEWADEKAGDAIAKQEEKEGGWDAGANQAWNENAEPVTVTETGEPVPEGEGEAESNSKSYAEYLAEQAAKKLEGLGLKEARAPNEGAKEDKKWKSAKELTKEQTEDYFKGEEKARRERERATKKEFLNIDYTFKEQPRETRGGRGGRGGRGRGGERGDFRGDRGDRPERAERGERPERGERGERGDRGDFRGEYRGRGRGRGDRGGDRGEYRGRGGRGRGSSDGPGVAVNDENAFPSLGGK